MKKIILFLFLLTLSFFAFSQSFNPQDQTKIKYINYWNITDNKEIRLDSINDVNIEIYNILESNKIIPYVYKDTNEKGLKWIDSTSWIFSSIFNMTKEDINQTNINIILGEVNCFGKLYINERFVDSTENEFINYSFDIKPYTKEGINSIKLVIEPALLRLNYNHNEYNVLSSEKRVINRNKQYRYGWDWYPSIQSAGFSTIFLRLSSHPIIDFANIQTLSYNKDSAEMMLNIGFSYLDNAEEYLLILSNREFKPYVSSLHNNSHLEKTHTFKINKDSIDRELGYFRFKFSIPSPRLWNIKNMGEQNVYTSKLELYKNKEKDSIPLSYKDINFGIRTIDLIRDRDSIGESFYFKLNGKPIFAKGANYIMTKENGFHNVLNNIRNSNINTLRVWGGSAYGNEFFYDFCDKEGILVWQDFPFACALYPADSLFLNNVKKEVEENIKRIATHPCLSLWCGNNEIWEGWKNWGWINEVKDTAMAVRNYDKLFKNLLYEEVKKHSPTIDYIHTSPLYGWGRKESLTHSDSHYWGVWWADSTFETYTRKIPRFMSEFGFQAPPTLSTIKVFMTLPYSKSNESFAIHQKHPRGFELIDSRLKEYFNTFSFDQDYIYKAQAIQQDAYKIAIEAHRRAKPYCMGTLFWQLNDAYPAISWSVIDSYHQKKPAFHTINEAFAPIIFSIDNVRDKDSLHLYYCNDTDSNFISDIKISLYDNCGKEKHSQILESLLIEDNKSYKFLSLCPNTIKCFNPQTDYLYVCANINGRLVDAYTFFVKPKDYISSSSKTKIKKKKIKTGYYTSYYSIKSPKKVLRNIIISKGETYIMDILPNKTYTIFTSPFFKFNITELKP